MQPGIAVYMYNPSIPMAKEMGGGHLSDSKVLEGLRLLLRFSYSRHPICPNLAIGVATSNAMS